MAIALGLQRFLHDIRYKRERFRQFLGIAFVILVSTAGEPKKILFFAGAVLVILGIAAGVGVGAVMEFADSTIRSPKDIRRITGHPVLASIPDVAEVQKKRGRNK